LSLFNLLLCLDLSQIQFFSGLVANLQYGHCMSIEAEQIYRIVFNNDLVFCEIGDE
jgi:hypothetical protein